MAGITGGPGEGPRITAEDGEGVPEPAFRPVTHATLTDVIDANNGNLPSPRYPRSSAENTNRFYVADPAAAGDMRAKLIQGEKFPGQRPNEVESIPDIGQGGVWDSGDTGGSPRAKDTKHGE